MSVWAVVQCRSHLNKQKDKHQWQMLLHVYKQTREVLNNERIVAEKKQNTSDNVNL